MASSSRAITSSVSFAGRRPSSSSSSSYDVFINFRGTDTRTNFVCLLYNALKKDGVNAYRDSEEIWEGEEICGSLLRAIRGSEISIPVFSKNYADSKYCLLELAEMWECHLSDGQTILPVFIDVEPRDVRHQTGSFEKPLQEHQRKCKYADVESWKNALTEVGKLKGWTLMGDATIEDQSHLVELIIQRVLRELSSTPLDECKHPVGMESQVNNLLSLLNIGSEDVQFVAICGMGGLGKTTIAKVIYNRIFRSFNGSSFLTDVREEASQGNKGLVSLQKRLLVDILKRDHDVSNICQGSKLIKNLLHGKKVLLILDDVDDHEQLDVLAGGINWFGQGSKVIITTRDDQSLDANKVETDIQIYKLQALDFENSLQLLSVYAFSKNEPPKNYKQLSHEIVSHADGLPLTLEVLGSFLFGKDKKEWEETLGGLKDILNNKVSGMSVKSYDDKVFAKLMISYNKLSEHAKIIFLDIACHFIGWKAEEAISLWEACELRPRLLIKELTQKHLLKIDDYGILRMHDQLSYMGRSIVSKDSYGDPTKRTRLWSHDEILEVFQKGTGTQMVEGILRKNFDFAAKDDISWEDFAKMPNLRFLDFHKSGNLNGDFSHLSSKLRWFRWYYCPLKIISSNFYHEELVHLELSYSDTKLAWPDIPQNKNKRFQKLKVLILDHCFRLSCSPHFSWFPCLQRLELTYCSSLLELPYSICQMASLKSLILNYCQSLNKLPMSIGDLKQLVMLSMCGTIIEELPDGVGQLEKLEDLDVSGCLKLVKLPASMGRMRSLLHFYLPNTMIVNLPDDFSELPCSLTHLDASHSEWLKVLSFYDCKFTLWVRSSDLSNLKRLRELDICYCVNLEEIHGLEVVECLEVLKSFGCYKLRELRELSNLKKLRELNISRCDNLEEIHSLEGAKCLEVLRAVGCNKLRELPEMSNLKRLRELDISYCGNLEEIHGLEVVECLEVLKAIGCNKL
ncbi:disease resistance protein RUN1-like isoform X1 [Macadamia integrifolia]|uniref:disease resistance protein RUN1-like isoform X1 n=1 Tax=Macadamia integrifolia TaxID=60698 RepID=UPI001C52C798|nr:disease resistance protein RUN1-like isoform X1 [Macadamia integrifolia]